MGDLQQRAPDLVLELGAGGAQRDGEDAAIADEVLAQLQGGELEHGVGRARAGDQRRALAGQEDPADRAIGGEQAQRPERAVDLQGGRDGVVGGHEASLCAVQRCRAA
mgnify:CR=1 FL=1